MARPLRINYPGAYYHITSRGNQRRAIFNSNRDRERFLGYLESASLRYGAVIHIFCLMGNHYHLLMETPSANLPQIMRHINGAYTVYFNIKHKRSGPLFQGRYKAILVDADEYAVELSRYIHLNPVRAKMVESPEKYEWSSFQDYIGIRKPYEWVQKDFILRYFSNATKTARKEYRRFIGSFVNREYESPLKKVFASTILGGQGFIDYIKKKHMVVDMAVREIPAAKVLIEKTSMAQIIDGVDQEIPDSRLSRDVKQYLCHRYTSEKLENIGNMFSISGSAVSHASARVSKLILKDKEVLRKVDKLTKTLQLSRFKT